MIAIIIIIATVLIDQFAKLKAVSLKLEDINIISDKLKLTYLENRGAAFGFLQNKKIILTILTVAILVMLSFILVKNYKKLSLITIISLSLIIGGAIGNFIDRMARGYVVDYISYTFFNGYGFPVFNLADIFVVSGCVLMMISLFVTKDLEGI